VPPCDFGPLLNFVGRVAPPFRSDAGIAGPGSPAGTPTTLFPAYCAKVVRWWVEQQRPGAALLPSDLWAAMVQTRQARLGANKG
jgi:hypothetical protein